MPIQHTSNTYTSGFSFTKIVIIHSIPQNEIQTAQIHIQYLQPLLENTGINIPIEPVICESSSDFMEILNRLKIEAKSSNQIPLLQVECHGDKDFGLTFADDSELFWPQLAKELTDLNRACGFNLLSIFSACFGAYFLPQIEAVGPAPCWCMIAPTETVNPGEVLTVIRNFYTALFQTMNVGKAIIKVTDLQMENGRWFGQTAELWYVRIVTNYLMNHCTVKETRNRTKNMYRQIRKSGQYKSIGWLKRQLRKDHRQKIRNEFFDRFFMVEDLPMNRVRFKAAREIIDRKYEGLRSNIKYNL